MFDKIVIPLDGSPRAELILSQVAKILRRKDSRIVLLRVVDIPEISRFEHARRATYETVRGAERAEAHRYVHELARRFEDGGIRVQARIAEGPAAGTILDVAKEEEATLIAMTTHGRTGLPRWFAGSVAEKVVRASPVPVLLVRSFRSTPLGDLQPATAGELPFRKLLVPTDGSPAAATAFGPAAAAAQLFDSDVVVLHVEPPVVIPGAGEMAIPVMVPPPPADQDPMTEEPANRFRELGLAVKRCTAAGNPAEEILDRCRTEDADLIVMSTHGRSGFSRWVLGSVAERVLRHSGVPLLLIQAEKSTPRARRTQFLVKGNA
jgi:nucleotide-binding universal stress UspA family protein